MRDCYDVASLRFTLLQHIFLYLCLQQQQQQHNQKWIKEVEPQAHCIMITYIVLAILEYSILGNLMIHVDPDFSS